MVLLDSVLLRTCQLIFQSLNSKKARLILSGFRPVVICFVTVPSADLRKFLVIRPASNPNIWTLPQEGIEQNETLEFASMRCLDIELGIGEKSAQFRKSGWIGKRKIPIERIDERDVEGSARQLLGLNPMIGKGYFAALVYVDPDAKVIPNLAEVIESKWVSKSEFSELIKNNEAEKIAILERVASVFSSFRPGS